MKRLTRPGRSLDEDVDDVVDLLRRLARLSEQRTIRGVRVEIQYADGPVVVKQAGRTPLGKGVRLSDVVLGTDPTPPAERNTWVRHDDVMVHD